MFEGPSTTGISTRILDEAIKHAHVKYPFDVLEPERVRSLALAVRTRQATEKTTDTIGLRRKAIAGIGVPPQSTRFLAYMVALERIERLTGSHASTEVLAVNEQGPMTLAEVYGHIRTGAEFEVPTTH